MMGTDGSAIETTPTRGTEAQAETIETTTIGATPETETTKQSPDTGTIMMIEVTTPAVNGTGSRPIETTIADPTATKTAGEEKTHKREPMAARRAKRLSVR